MTDYRDGDWHVWLGGECPFKGDDLVDIIIEGSPDVSHMVLPFDFNWALTGCSMSIIAVRHAGVCVGTFPSLNPLNINKSEIEVQW